MTGETGAGAGAVDAVGVVVAQDVVAAAAAPLHRTLRVAVARCSQVAAAEQAGAAKIWMVAAARQVRVELGLAGRLDGPHDGRTQRAAALDAERSDYGPSQAIQAVARGAARSPQRIARIDGLDVTGRAGSIAGPDAGSTALAIARNFVEQAAARAFALQVVQAAGGAVLLADAATVRAGIPGSFHETRRHHRS